MLYRLSYEGQTETGALGRFRADDLAITSRVLCHLSYESDVASPHGFAPRPSVLETDVLLLNTTEMLIEQGAGHDPAASWLEARRSTG